MSIYPSSIGYQNPLKETIRFKTMVSQFDEQGMETRKRKWLFPRRDITLTYNGIDKSEAQVIWAFYIARQGSYSEFSFFEYNSPTPRSYTSEYIGKGDGATRVFNLPAKGSSSVHTVRVGGQASTAYVFSAGGGPDGEDKITFSTAAVPTSTQYITYSFTGRLKTRCRFAEDTHTFDSFYDSLVNSGVTLRGVLNQ